MGAETIEIHGFDPQGEPIIHVAEDGTIQLSFCFMPPSWTPAADRVTLGAFHDFDQRLEQALGVPVAWEDRELFRIEAPRADTVERLKAFLLEQGKGR